MKSINEAVATINEREILMNFLDQLSEKEYSLNFDVKNVMNDVPQRAVGIVTEIFNEAFSKGPKAVVREIEKSMTDLKEMPIVTLTIAIEPTIDLYWNIKNWFLTQIGKNVLVEFKIDKSLLGGAIVESDGKRSEHSFRLYFEERKGKN